MESNLWKHYFQGKHLFYSFSLVFIQICWYFIIEWTQHVTLDLITLTLFWTTNTVWLLHFSFKTSQKKTKKKTRHNYLHCTTFSWRKYVDFSSQHCMKSGIFDSYGHINSLYKFIFTTVVRVSLSEHMCSEMQGGTIITLLIQYILDTVR